MFQKIVLTLFIISSLFLWNNVFAAIIPPADLKSPSFTIDTWEFSVGWNGLKEAWNSQITMNNVLWRIIQKLMIALWVIALLIMTIGAGYMITFHGSDEFLNKGKSIFIGWITALIVALSSYYLVNLVGYILYK